MFTSAISDLGSLNSSPFETILCKLNVDLIIYGMTVKMKLCEYTASPPCTKEIVAIQY